MKINKRIHHQIRLQNFIFSLLFIALIGLLAWLSTRYTVQFDWTAGARHTLSETSRKVLDTLEDPVQITAYAREDRTLRDQVRDLANRYQRYKSDIALKFVNPDTQPDKVRELGITVDGELVIEYEDRTEKIQSLNEMELTNALQRLARSEERWIVFLQGHGERSPQGQANHDLGQFGHELERKGIRLLTLNLATSPAIPDNTAALVIASPQVSLLPGEVELIQKYVERGGNLLWLSEPGALHGLEPVAEQLGIQFLPGTVVDATTQLFGINDPSFALVANYPFHPITQGFQALTVFPKAAAMEVREENQFDASAFLTTLPRSWTETGPLEDQIEFNADSEEREGPLNIGFALEKEVKENPEKNQENNATLQQRIVVLGDGDFLSNAFLGNGGNLNLGLNIVQWLSHNDQFINIPAKTAPDLTLELTPTASAFIGLGFLVLLPLLLAGTGALIWFQRRRR